jgi:hypothetical protein
VPFCIAQNGDEWFACLSKENAFTFSFFWKLELELMGKNMLEKKDQSLFITVYLLWLCV